ncbi:MAG: alpha-galactosidase [Clostridia bacterium]
MKANKMCPFCYIKKLFTPSKKVTDLYVAKPYENGVANTPPMGWSSWNTFRNRIDQHLIFETALAMKEKGLADAGYTYINIDDNWVSNQRDENGNLQGDLVTFSEGIPALVKKVNSLGLKLGIYSSNGTETCEDLPASLYHERADAYTFAKWGIEYFKYDFCHNIPYSKYAPLIFGLSICKKGLENGKTYLCENAKLSGFARLMTKNKIDGGQYVSGLDKNGGAMEYDNILADEDGEYVVTLNIVKHGNFSKSVMAIVNDVDEYIITVPPQKFFNVTGRFSTVVKLNKGLNKIRLFNPIGSRADSAMLQYRNMGEMLKRGAQRVADETNAPIKPIVFSLCEWGRNQPYKWGATAGNLWRTTMDIRPIWPWIMHIYNHTVKLFEYSRVGAWNDPDMLEVGNGKLTYDENISHFSLWCMLCAPLILGNDLRAMPQNILDIVSNKNLIAINQDRLGKQAKRFITGRFDVLVKPLYDGSTAVLILNKSNHKTKYKLDIAKILAEKYSGLKKSSSYEAIDQWTGAVTPVTDSVSVNLNPHGVSVLKLCIKNKE